METESYEYTGMHASTWDVLRGDTSHWPDRTFYRDLIGQYGQPALDVGCGTGRLLLDYLANGIDIDGVDDSPEMLALCRESAQSMGLSPALFTQKMQRLALPRTYRSIIVPSSSFQLLTDQEEATAAMKGFFCHLQSGGMLAIVFMVPINSSTPEAMEWTLEARRPQDGCTIRRWLRLTYDVSKQLASTEDRYDVLRDGQIIDTQHFSRSPALRWYTQQQAKRLYEDAGFSRLHLFKGFSQEPASPDDRTFTIVGMKP